MGKGLEIPVILELLLYVSASLIPLALPLAILLSSIMTFGNLAEHNELTALKASGLSLYRIMRPLTIIVIGICLCTFYFANYVIPIANLKWRSLIYDIQETKIASIITPGSYSTELSGFAIKVNEEKNGVFKKIVIHDQRNPSLLKTIKAEDAQLFKSNSGLVLFLKLFNGHSTEEITPNGETNMGVNGNYYPSRRTNFSSAIYQIDLNGFKLNRSDQDLFKNSYEMLNVFQINSSLDSIQKENKKILANFVQSIKNEHSYFYQSKITSSIKKIKNDSIIKDTTQPLSVKTNALFQSNKNLLDNRIKTITKPPLINKLTQNTIAIEKTISKIRRKIENIEGQQDFIKSLTTNIDLYKIEFHRKYALTFVILVLFFVGAPLGAIVRKGGFGAPVVIACLLFMIYFILSELGEGLISSGKTTPFIGMWLATICLIPIAYLLMYSAANDSKIISLQYWKKIIKRRT